MKNQTPFPERLQRALAPTHRGVIGVVDDLLGLCRGQGLELTWHTNKCQVRPLGTEPQEATEVPLPKSVFRAILARLAALCNERSPNSVSPYRGEGEFSVGTSPPAVFRVAFTNTPGEQRVEVRRQAADKEQVEGFTALSQASGTPQSLSANEKAILLALVTESRGLGWGVAVYPFEDTIKRQGIELVDAHITVAGLQQKGLVRLEERAGWDDLRDRPSLYPVYCVTVEGFTAALQARIRG